jgi:hypothetical protein
MTQKPFALVCAECDASFETAAGMMDHLLVTRHMDVPVDADSGDLQEFIEVLTLLQHFADAGPDAELPEGVEIRPVSEQDILDDDELPDEVKAEFLRKMSGIRVRRATDDEQHAAIVEVARRQVTEDGATHDCGEWVKDGRCQLCDRPMA